MAQKTNIGQNFYPCACQPGIGIHPYRIWPELAARICWRDAQCSSPL